MWIYHSVSGFKMLTILHEIVFFSQMALAAIIAMEAEPADILNVSPESLEGYVRKDEIPEPLNDPLLLEEKFVRQKDFYPDHTRKNTILRNDIFDYMEETGDLRFLDHELEQMIEADARKYTDMMIRLSKYRENELGRMNAEQEEEEEMMKDPVYIKEQTEKMQKEQELRKQDYQDFLIVKANKDFE